MFFKDLFFHFGIPELKSIAGKWGVNFIVLSIVCFVSILVIGLGNSSIEILRAKMDSPFVRFINVVVEWDKQNLKGDMKELSQQNLKAKFGYDGIEPVVFESLNFADKNGRKIKNVYCRRITESSRFYQFINDKNSNIAISDLSLNDKTFGIIITQKLATELDFQLEDEFVFFSAHFNNGELIPIKVEGIVKELPDYVDVLLSKSFHDSYRSDNKLAFITSNMYHQDYLRYYLKDYIQYSKEIEELGFNPIDDFPLNTDEGLVIERLGSYSESLIEKMDDLENSLRLFNFQRAPIQVLNYKPEPHKLSFEFNRLDSITSFSSYMKTKDLTVDMNIVQSKKNFDFFNRLAKGLSNSLILFSIFFIFMYITLLISNHLDKNQLNLGTLKAFGLSNRKVIFIYSLLSVILIIASYLLGLILATVVGKFFFHFVLEFLGIAKASSDSYQNLSQLDLISFFVILPGLAVGFGLLIKLRNRTPGDLIYNR